MASASIITIAISYKEIYSNINLAYWFDYISFILLLEYYELKAIAFIRLLVREFARCFLGLEFTLCFYEGLWNWILGIGVLEGICIRYD